MALKPSIRHVCDMCMPRKALMCSYEGLSSYQVLQVAFKKRPRLASKSIEIRFVDIRHFLWRDLLF